MISTHMLRRSMGAALLSASVLAASGCAVLGPKTPEQQVATRAADYWKARIAGNYEAAYALTAPSYRKLKSASDFRLQFGSGAAIQKAHVSKVVCEPQKCEVQMQLAVTPAIIGLKIPSIDTYLNEVWLLEDGQWWHFQDL